MKYPDRIPYLAPETREHILAMVRNGRYIQAIALVRRVTGAELKEAKEFVDGLKGEAFGRVVPPDTQAQILGLIASGRTNAAVKLAHQYIGLNKGAAKDFVNALQRGEVPAPPAPPPAPPLPAPPLAPGPAGPPSGMLSDRVRAFKAAEDYESAIALVCAETGMARDEAKRFVDALQ